MTTRRATPDPGHAFGALRELGYTDEDAILVFQREWGLPVTGRLDSVTLVTVLDVREAHEVAERHQHPRPAHAVKGLVTSTGGEPAPDLEVQLVEVALRSENVVGSTHTDAQGHYAIPYPRERGTLRSTRALLVRVLDGETVAVRSSAHFDRPPLLEIDLSVDPVHVHAPTEYERLLEQVRTASGKLAVADLGDADVAFLSGSLQAGVDQVVELILAQRLEAASSVDAAFFYALLRQDTLFGRDPSRLSLRFAVSLSTPVQPLFYDVVLLDAATVHAAVDTAIARRVVPASLAGELDAILATLRRSAPAARSYHDVEQPRRVIDAVAANVVAGRPEQVLQILQQHGHGDPTALAGALGAVEIVQPGGDGNGGASKTVAALLAADPELLTDLQALAQPNAEAPAFDSEALAGTPAQAARAAQRFPTAAFAASLASSKPSPLADAVARTLQANPGFDLATGSVDRLLGEGEIPAVKGVDAAALHRRLKATQRVFKLAPNHAQTSALLDAGLHSAAHIAALGRTQFVKRAAASGAFTAAEADAVFNRAHDVHTATSLLAGELRGIATGTLAAIGGDVVAEKLQLVARDNPNLHNLFSLPDMCECSECRSIISPAAYLVDVLQFLKNRLVVDTTTGPPVATRSAKDVLFARRPDLGDIDLTCDNANVPLPYIDVVCELLEELVAPDPGFAFNGAVAPGLVPGPLLAALTAQGLPFTAEAMVQEADAAGNLYVRDAKVVCKLTPSGAANTWTVRQLRETFRSAAELAAAPEYVNDAAYQALQASKVAFTLPFDLHHEECRAYFSQFGVPRDQLMRALATGAAAPQPRDWSADALDISDAERAIIGAPDVANQNVYWNTGGADPATVVNVVDTFLTRTGLDYAGLQALLDRAFVNPGGAMFIHHQDLSCDTTRQDIANLDDNALDRIHRFLRLVRRLGWDMATVDHAVMAARLGNGQISDDPLLVRLADLERLQARLGLGVDDLVVFYGLIPTDSDPSRYTQLFLNPSSNGTVEPRLAVDAVTANQALPMASRTMLGDVAPALATALGIRAADLDLLIAALAAAPHDDASLTFANLASLYAYAALARALGSSVADLLLLVTLTGIDPLASPADTARLVAEYDRLGAAGTRPADLRFLLSFTAADAAALAARTLQDDSIAAMLTALQARLQAAYVQTRSPFDATRSADENKDALRDVVGHLPGVSQAQLASLVAIVDNAYAGPGTAGAFLDSLLGPFLDTTGIDALQATLAATSAAPPAPLEAARLALIQAILAAVSAYLYAQERDAAVVDAVATGLHLDAALAGVLLGGGHMTIAAVRRTLLSIIGDDSLIDTGFTPPAPPSPPAITPAAFHDQYAAVRLLRQMALVAATLPLTVDDLRWLLDNAQALGWLQLDQLPYQGAMAAVPLTAWDQLEDAAGLLQRYPPVVDPGNPDTVLTMRSVFDLALTGGTTIGQLLDRLAAVTGWDRTVLGDLDTRFGLSGGGLGPYLLPATHLQLEAAVVPLRRLGLDVASGVALIKPQLTAADAMTLRQALKARYAAADWLGVLKQIYDPLRGAKRDALVAMVLNTNADFTSGDDLFDYLLVDVEMGACAPTSRIVSAHGTLQLFVQRCLLGVEPTAVADTSEDDGWSQWTWMQAFRVWQANREVFLFPENWLDPAVRDDKTEQFKAFEDALQQNSLTDDSVSDAVAGYLEGLDDISFLEVLTACYDERTYTMHVFARTKGGDPPTYYHRRYVEEKVWTPWEKVDLDIKGNHLVSYLRNGRLQLAWPIFTAQANPDQEMKIPTSGDQGSDAPKTEQAWQIQIAVSELRNDGWTPSRAAQDPMPWNFGYQVTLPLKRDFRFVPFDVRGSGFSVLSTFDFPTEGGSSVGELTANVLLGGFEMTGCKGYPVAYGDQPFTELLFLPQFRETEVADERFAETAAGNDDLSIMPVWSRRWAQLFRQTPDTFRVTYPQQMALIDYIALILLLLSGAARTSSFGDRAVYSERRSRLPIPLGTLMPFFYEDGVHDYAVVPGFFGVSKRDRQHGTRVRRTYSDILKLVQALVLLAEEYFKKLQQDPNHDLAKVLQELFKDPQWISLREQILSYRGLAFGYEFDDFYHPLVCPLREVFYRDGVDALMARSTQLQVSSFDFSTNYSPTPAVIRPYPIEDLDFRPGASYAGYNWELFFHLPVNVAHRLEQDQQFEKATHWFHRVFDPTDTSNDTVPRKYWQTKPFYQFWSSDYVNQRIDTIMDGIASDPSGASIADLAFAVSQWRENPFEPFLVARTRPVAFQVATVMQYVDNLIAWGDSLFTQDTMESVNQATQMYVLADKLLGPQPRIVPPVVTPPAETYNQLEARIDLFGNALLDLEALVPDLNLLPHHGAELPPNPLSLTSLYFCIPPNSKLLGYWGTVSDRLTKIRNCQDINGVERQLALFAPPIDPGALIAAAAQGLSIADVLRGLNAPLPLYRFSVMAQKATELIQLVVTLGNDVLAALEKRDAEALARLRATQEISLLGAVEKVKEQQVADAQSQIDVLQRSIEVTTAKSQYYHARQFMNAAETLALQLTALALVPQALAMGLDTGAAVANLVPSFSVGAAGFGGSPEATVSYGGSNVGSSLAGFAGVARAVAGLMQTGAGMATTLGSYQRRQDEWTFQATLADKELVQLQKQQDQARIKLAVAEADLAAHRRQMANAGETDRFLRSKFTDRELYDYMLGKLSGVYFRAYQLALDIAHKAERCFQHELGSEQTFVRFDYWDSLKKGLLAGQRLLNDVKQMETQYLAQNRREYELTKHVSLAQLDPLALLQLKTTGACTFNLPEALFDLDHPGHYFRRLKTVALSVPCVAGPYATVSCKLSLVGNRYRRSTGILGGPDGYAEVTPSDDRFVYNVGAIQSIATSQGQNDSGMFELSFHDDRYLPFEGQGAVSGWRLELPAAVRQFDYDSITDVVLHVRYTARDGGSGFAGAAASKLAAHLSSMLVDAQRNGLHQSFDIRREFPDEWHLLKQNGTVQISIDGDRLPFFTRGHAPAVDTAIWVAGLQGNPASYTMNLDGTPFTLNSDSNFTPMLKGSSTPPPLGTAFTLSTANPALLQDLALVIHYTVS